MKKLGLVAGMLLAAITIASSARSATVDFWLAKADDPTGQAITSIDVAPGAAFGLSVWYQTDSAWDHSTFEVMLGFDSSTSMGTNAVSVDHKVALNGDATTAVSNVNANFSAKLAQVLAGGRAATGSRPYGLRISYAIPTGAANVQAVTPAKLFDISLVNNMVNIGDSYNVQIWNNPALGVSYTSFLMNRTTDTIRDATNSAVTVNTALPVPEPGSLLALGAGLMSLTGFIVRRRK